MQTLCATLCRCALLTLTLVGCGPNQSNEADEAGGGGGAGGVNGTSVAGAGGTDATGEGGASLGGSTDPGGLLGDECWAHPDCESGVCWTWSILDSACLGNMCSIACRTDQECAKAADQIKARKPNDPRIFDAWESSAATCESTGCDFSLVFSFHSCA